MGFGEYLGGWRVLIPGQQVTWLQPHLLPSSTPQGVRWRDMCCGRGGAVWWGLMRRYPAAMVPAGSRSFAIHPTIALVAKSITHFHCSGVPIYFHCSGVITRHVDTYVISNKTSLKQFGITTLCYQQWNDTMYKNYTQLNGSLLLSKIKYFLEELLKIWWIKPEDADASVSKTPRHQQLQAWPVFLPLLCCFYLTT